MYGLYTTHTPLCLAAKASFVRVLPWLARVHTPAPAAALQLLPSPLSASPALRLSQHAPHSKTRLERSTPTKRVGQGGSIEGGGGDGGGGGGGGGLR